MDWNELTEEEYDALMETFTVAGSCGCDGYYDSGCPACNPEIRAMWVEQRRENPPDPSSILD